MDDKYFNLIKSWHIKANQEDYFSKFTFEYLAFIAFIRTQKYTDSFILQQKSNGSGRVTDRDYIQTLKRDISYKQTWIDLIGRGGKEVEIINDFKTYLSSSPLIVNDGWWDNDNYIRSDNINVFSGAINNADDYINIIEIIYTLRNNLFHGTKGPEVERDSKLIKFAFYTLSFFVDNVLINIFEKNRFYPFFGHEFIEKFYVGDAEVTCKPNGEGAWANIYEVAFLADNNFPILIENKTFSRKDLIDKIRFNLSNAYGVGDNRFDSIMSRIISVINGDQAKEKIADEYLSDYFEIYKKEKKN